MERNGQKCNKWSDETCIKRNIPPELEGWPEEDLEPKGVEMWISGQTYSKEDDDYCPKSRKGKCGVVPLVRHFEGYGAYYRETFAQFYKRITKKETSHAKA